VIFVAAVLINQGIKDTIGFLLEGGGDMSLGTTLFQAFNGDMQLEIDVPALAPKPTAAAWSQTLIVKLVNANGDIHKWYSGPVTIAIGDTSSAGSAAISPGAGAVNMVDGVLAVVVSGDAQAWLNADTVTLTASIAAQAAGDTTILGYLIANHTGVITFTT
jgi:hypothetical protein